MKLMTAPPMNRRCTGRHSILSRDFVKRFFPDWLKFRVRLPLAAW
jgi:hypothetical protein